MPLKNTHQSIGKSPITVKLHWIGVLNIADLCFNMPVNILLSSKINNFVKEETNYFPLLMSFFQLSLCWERPIKKAWFIKK